MFKAAVLTCASLTAASASAAPILFDFGSIDQQTTDTGWNNVTYPTNQPAPGLTNIVDSNGATVAGIALVITDPFYVKTQPSLLGTDTPTGDASIFAPTATEDFFLGHTGEFNGAASNPTAGFKFTGLDANQTYNFTFFASRDGVGDNRETQYTVTGSNTANGLLNASNNDDTVLTLAGITPDANNEILVSLAAGPNNTNARAFYYISALQLDAVPEPGALALLAVGGLIAVSARRRRA